ncbi:DNA-directed RNA polymerase III subunit C34 [Martiniozyma asiatica (nom. inval.)]|nr:DNA-directed RNA polymerase III subunit C34 [Martiniozyma asiatica]
MGKDVKMEMTSEASKLHEMMIIKGKSTYTQQELLDLCGFTNAGEFMSHAQILLNGGLMKLLDSQSEGLDEKVLLFAPVTEQEAQKVKNMSADEAMVYTHIEAAGREGIWTKTIKAKTNLHQHIVLRCLKSLESQSYIKAVKSVKHPTRKIYMLYHLTPSIDVTGGPWFTDSELDTEFIESLLVVIWRFIAGKTYPKVFKFKGFIPNGLKQYNYPADQIMGMGSSLPSLADISDFISKSGITAVELSVSDIKSLCTVLEYDEKIEEINGGRYKATWQSVLEGSGGKVEGEQQFEVQNDVMFNIMDKYRVLQSEESSESSNTASQTFYLDSWVSL